MATIKITGMATATSLVAADLVPVVTDVSTTAVNKKITFANFLTSFGIAIGTFVLTTGKLLINPSGTAITVNAPVNYAADGEVNDTYVITLDPAITAYTAGLQIIFKATTANTGAATINVNGLGAKTIVKAVSTALSDNDILADMICLLIYDGTNFVLLNPRVL